MERVISRPAKPAGFVYKMAQGGGRSPFVGFKQQDINDAGELNYKLGLRKIEVMEQMLQDLVSRVTVLEADKAEWSVEKYKLREELAAVNKENENLKQENESLKMQLRLEMSEVRKSNENMQMAVQGVEEKQTEWMKKNEETGQSLKKIMEQQQKDENEMKEKIVSVIKEKKNLVRDTIDKIKCVIVFGVKEEKIVNRMEREEKEKDKIKHIIATVVDDEDQAIRAVEEYHRLGKYEENKDRPIKIKFATQVMAEEVLNGAWKLARKEEYKKVWINRDLDGDEREKLKELVQEAKQKNDSRSVEEREQFYWKVRDLRLKKIHYRR